MFGVNYSVRSVILIVAEHINVVLAHPHMFLPPWRGRSGHVMVA